MNYLFGGGSHHQPPHPHHQHLHALLQQQQQQATGPPEVIPPATEIIPGLYLGGKNDVAAHTWSHVLNLWRKELPSHGDFRARAGSNYLHVPFADLPEEEFRLITELGRILRFLDAAMAQSGACVLIHCRKGISRSATVCAAYLMHSGKAGGAAPTAAGTSAPGAAATSSGSGGTSSSSSTTGAAVTTPPTSPTSLDATLAYMRQRRPQVAPNLGFMRFLEWYAQHPAMFHVSPGGMRYPYTQPQQQEVVPGQRVVGQVQQGQQQGHQHQLQHQLQHHQHPHHPHHQVQSHHQQQQQLQLLHHQQHLQQQQRRHQLQQQFGSSAATSGASSPWVVVSQPPPPSVQRVGGGFISGGGGVGSGGGGSGGGGGGSGRLGGSGGGGGTEASPRTAALNLLQRR